MGNEKMNKTVRKVARANARQFMKEPPFMAFVVSRAIDTAGLSEPPDTDPIAYLSAGDKMSGGSLLSVYCFPRLRCQNIFFPA